uniref:Si:ch73-290k24.5 n=1 Tax=Salarias fasciatus TaxID=181472 RepID=A0A672F3W5_SALFA
MSSSSSSSSSSSLAPPLFCPRCGDVLRFSSVPELRAHLVSRHSYDTLLLLSQSSRPGTLLPLPGPPRTRTPPLDLEPRGAPPPLAFLDLASSSASAQLLGNLFRPLNRLLVHVGPGLEERLGLGLDRWVARSWAELEERFSRRAGRLRAELHRMEAGLQRKEAELQQQRRGGERLRQQKQEVEDRAQYLSRQVCVCVRMENIDLFLRVTAEKEAEAKSRLQVLMGSVLFCWVLMGPAGFCSVLLGSDGSCWVLLSDSNTHTHTNTSPGVSSSLWSPRCHGNLRPGAETLRLRAGLFCVFPYLDVRSLLLAAEVCSDWRMVARHPAVWTRLRLEDGQVSTEFLSTLSQWCTQTQSIVLNNLKPRSRRNDETREDYLRTIRGSVEAGLEAVLRAAGGSLLSFSVSDCPHVVTDRCLWLISCYSRNLLSLRYRSSTDPPGPEVLWALGAGCRSLRSLQVAPAAAGRQPTRFSNRCLQMIGRCWPRLHTLSVGGAGCGTPGLVAAVRSCSDLQVLELECISDLGLQAATELCAAGLKKLHTLVLTHTPVSGQAVLHFHSVCQDLRTLVVQVSASDYFEDPESEEAQQLFREILDTLKVLQTRPGLCDVLQVKAEGFS